MPELVIRDESMTGRPTGHEVVLADLPDRISVRDLVRFRVREEVARHNLGRARVFHGLVQPVDAEIEVNGYRTTPARRIDWEAQAEVALEAFSRNGFVVLVDGRQVDDLDEELMVSVALDVAFVKLVALVGG